ncbi:MAG: hypothetical protein ACFNS5_09120, partial [Prevotella melaninogenica]
MDALDRNTHYSYLSDSNKNISFSIQPHLKEFFAKTRRGKRQATARREYIRINLLSFYHITFSLAIRVFRIIFVKYAKLSLAHVPINITQTIAVPR